MAQDVVSGGDVEKELRNAKGEQQRPASEFALGTVSKRERHFFFSNPHQWPDFLRKLTACAVLN
jgi:hypothetical protein